MVRPERRTHLNNANRQAPRHDAGVVAKLAELALPHLTEAEAALNQTLSRGPLRRNVRQEQERISYGRVLAASA